METFQKLFKSSHKKHTAQQQKQQIHQENNKPELINYQKRTLNALNNEANIDQQVNFKSNILQQAAMTRKQQEMLYSQPIKSINNSANLTSQVSGNFFLKKFLLIYIILRQIFAIIYGYT